MITLILIGLTVLVSVSAFSNHQLFTRFLFNAPAIRRGEWHRMLTHALIHADWGHLAVNMFSMYMFGMLVEDVFVEVFDTTKGLTLYVVLYVTGIVASSLPSLEKHKNNYHYNSVGASGAVSAVVFSAILLHPSMKLSLLILPIPIPAPIFGLLYLAYCWYAARNAQDHVAHDVHYWGSIYGLLFTGLLLPETLPGLLNEVISIIGL